MSLPQAVRENKLALVRQYSHMGQDLNVADWNGFTALHYAARANQVEVVMTLVECKVDINQQGRELLTPLHVAVRYVFLELCFSKHDLNKVYTLD